MAKLSIKGDLSGEISLVAPNNAGSPQLVLPTTGTQLLSDTSDISASKITGSITSNQISLNSLTLNSSNGSIILTPEDGVGQSNLTLPRAGFLTADSPVGCILQVKSYTKTNTWVSSGNFKDPGLDVQITPTSATSKILVNVSVCFSTSATTIGFILRRNGTNICIADAAGSRSRMTVITECGNNVWQTNANYMYLDNPGTTSTCTYDILIGSHDGREFRLNRSGSGTDNASLDNSYSTSTITVMEVEEGGL